MRVNLAAQVLSSSVATVLRSFGPAEATARARYCEMIDGFFDCLNVRSTLNIRTSTLEERYGWFDRIWSPNRSPVGKQNMLLTLVSKINSLVTYVRHVRGGCEKIFEWGMGDVNHFERTTDIFIMMTMYSLRMYVATKTKLRCVILSAVIKRLQEVANASVMLINC